MAYEPLKTEELKKRLLMGKRRAMNFAYNPGPKGADLLIIDRIKAPDVIGRTAKKEGEGPKVAFGTFEMDPKSLTLTVMQTVPGVARKFRKYLKSIDLSLKVIVLDAKGDVVDLAEDEDEPETPRMSGVTAPPNDDKQGSAAADIAGRLRLLQPPLANLGAIAAPLKKAALRVVADLRAGDLKQAEGTLIKIEEGLRKVAAHRAAKSAQPSTKEDQTGPSHKDLVVRAGTIKAALDQTRESAPDIVQPLVKAIGLIKSGDLAGADLAMQAAEDALNALQEPETDVADIQEPSATETDTSTEPSADQLEWEALCEALERDVEAALITGLGDLDAIQHSFDQASTLALAGSHSAALKAAKKTRKLLNETVEIEEETPTNIIAYRKSRQEWIKTHNAIAAELTKLQMAIDAEASRTEGMAQIAENTGVLLAYIDELDTTLETLLDRLIDTPQGPPHEKLKQDAVSVILTYRKTLDTDFFMAVDQNGFTDTDIRKTALNALKGVETALAA
ncbi:MAG: hypothetical protein ABJL67_08690 [Sulfitobacter sp.]